MDWNILLTENNHRKRGRPFKLFNAFLIFLARIRAVFNVPFGLLESIERPFSRVTQTRTLYYTNIFRRTSKIKPNLETTGSDPVECAIDSTGFKITAG